MKKSIKILSAVILLLFVLNSCKKEVSKITYDGGTAPVLTASNTDNITLDLANQAAPAISFTWTNPAYQFSTGLSSQNVAYTLEADTLGSFFSNPHIVQISVTNDQVWNLSIADLNDIIVGASKLGLAANVPHNIEFRVKSELGNGSVPLYSNTIVLMGLVPYPDPNVPHLWITGSATPSSWTNTPPPTQEFTHLTGLSFEYTIHFDPGGQYKFLTKQGQWQPQWGGCGASGGTLSVNDGTGSDPAEIPTPAVSGNYKITVDLSPANPNCTVVLQ